MRKLTIFLCVLIFGAVGTSNATLFDRGGGLIFSDVLDITLFQDAYYAGTSQFNWYEASAWVENLEYYDSVRDVTWTNWRLPDARNQDGSGPDIGFVSGSEGTNEA